jgi:hypothetical protein
MERDRATYKNLFKFFDFENKVSYLYDNMDESQMAHPEGSVLLLDEADHFIYHRIQWLSKIKTKIIGFTGSCGKEQELDSEIRLL